MGRQWRPYVQASGGETGAGMRDVGGAGCPRAGRVIVHASLGERGFRRPASRFSTSGPDKAKMEPAAAHAFNTHTSAAAFVGVCCSVCLLVILECRRLLTAARHRLEPIGAAADQDGKMTSVATCHHTTSLRRHKHCATAAPGVLPDRRPRIRR